MTKPLVLVTGATRGIGKAIAQQLGTEGRVVVGTATSEKGAESITAYLKEAGIEGQGMVLNVSDQESVDAVVKVVTEQYGTVDVLVNNAGITRDTLLMRMKSEDWDAVINTNLSSVYAMSKACIKGMMKARAGRIINISSVVGSCGNAGQANYAASKAGVEGFTRSLAIELGSRNITVNSVAPGYIATDMTEAMPEEAKDKMAAQIALGRLGKPEEIAAVVAMLAGEAGSYITGETIQVNGGIYMA